MSRHAQVARRYARALAETLQDTELEPMASALHALAEAVASSEPLRATLSNPAIPAPRRSALVVSLAQQAGGPPRLRRFVELLGERDRLGLLEEIAAEFDEAKDERTGRVRAELSTARPLDHETRERIRRALAKVTGRAVHIEERHEPALLGGVVARVDSTVYDGSLRRRLQGLRERILRSS